MKVWIKINCMIHNFIWSVTLLFLLRFPLLNYKFLELLILFVIRSVTLDNLVCEPCLPRIVKTSTSCFVLFCHERMCRNHRLISQHLTSNLSLQNFQSSSVVTWTSFPDDLEWNPTSVISLSVPRVMCVDPLGGRRKSSSTSSVLSTSPLLMCHSVVLPRPWTPLRLSYPRRYSKFVHFILVSPSFLPFDTNIRRVPTWSLYLVKVHYRSYLYPLTLNPYPTVELPPPSFGIVSKRSTLDPLIPMIRSRSSHINSLLPLVTDLSSGGERTSSHVSPRTESPSLTPTQCWVCRCVFSVHVS